MATSFKHDPLDAISEADATGETAQLFAEIRTTMRLPLLTSIWRVLAGVDGGLPPVWEAARPIFDSGFPDLFLAKLRNAATWPIPPKAEKIHLEALGLSRSERTVIRNIIDVYTRSNSLNLLVLTALIADPAGKLPDDIPSVEAMSIPKIPDLLDRNDIDEATWQLLLEINRFGGSPDEPGLATLWRHLAYWPTFLSIIHEVLTPLQQEGVITRSITQVLDVASIEGRRLALIRPGEMQIPESAHRMITNYVTHPGLVARMVAIGTGLSLWLQSDAVNSHV